MRPAGCAALVPLLVAAAVAASSARQAAPAFDLLLVNGRVVDGTGAPWFRADVGITGDRIAAIGRLADATARTRIDATDLVVAPGFIDMLGQSELSLLVDPRGASKLLQGITTELTGEGSSAGPINDRMIADDATLFERRQLTVDWRTLGEYLTRLNDRARPAINLGSFVGAGGIRNLVIGRADRPATPEELEAMKREVARAMDEGAFGLSSSLQYVPDRFASTSELVELARVAARSGGIYITHQRSESGRIFESMDEVFTIAEQAKIPAEIFHLKTAYQPNWGKMPEVLSRIRAARARGLDITADQYPYTRAANGLDACLPLWVREGTKAQMIARLKDPALRDRIKRDMADANAASWENQWMGSGGADGVTLIDVTNPALRQYEGLTLAEIGRRLNKDPRDVVADFVAADNAESMVVIAIMRDDDVETALKDPLVSIGTDFEARAEDGLLSESKSHPRAWGSFPRILGYYVREKQLLTLEEAIRKMTSRPAARVGLADRGILKPGLLADITVFDPAAIRDVSTYDNPTRYSVGVKHVIVNGQLAVRDGAVTGVRAGRALRGPGYRRATAVARSSGEAPDVDPAVRPQDDLYRYANGRWLDATVIPPDRVSFTSFIGLAERAEADVRHVIEAASRRPKRTPAEQQVADMYASMLNQARVEELGGMPLRAELERIDAVTTLRALAAEAGHLTSIGLGGPFFESLGLDAHDSTRRIVTLSQGGTLLDRTRYLNNDGESVRARANYAAYLATVFRLVGRTDPEADARAAIALETALARAQWTAADSRDPLKSRRPYTLDRMLQEMPGFDWRAWAEPQGIDRIEVVLVVQPSFFREFAALVSSTPLSSWRAWLAARFITAAAPFVSHEFSEARFDLFGRTLTGQEEPRADWKRGVAFVNAFLGQSVGRLYVKEHFSPDAKRTAEGVVGHVIEAFKESIGRADWLSTPAKREAQRKLSRTAVNIGYPDTWREYRGLIVRPDDLFGNLLRAQASEARFRQLQVGVTEQHDRWPMTPQTVNAFYNPATNEIVFPAAFLQAPVFDPRADAAENYGATGAVVGHELSHAFDEPGRSFDASGEARAWWSAADDAEYRARASRAAAQLNAYTPIPGVQLQGALVLAESLADLAGLQIAWRAYHRSTGGEAGPIVGNLTADQRLFLSWARVWRSKVRPEFLRQQLSTSPYAPAEIRASWPVSNLPEFAAAFGLRPGDRLYRAPEDRIRIW